MATDYNAELILPTRIPGGPRPLEVPEAEADFVNLALGLNTLQSAISAVPVGAFIMFSDTPPVITAAMKVGDVWIDTQKGGLYRLDQLVGTTLGWNWIFNFWPGGLFVDVVDPSLSTVDTNGNILEGYTYFNSASRSLWVASASVYQGAWQPTDPWTKVMDLQTLPDMANHIGHALFTDDGLSANWRKIRASDIQPDFNFSFSVNPSVVELGQVVNNPTFHASYNDTLLSARWKDNVTNTFVPVPLPATDFTEAKMYTNTSTGSVIYTLEGTGSSIVTHTASTTWYPRRFWGTGVVGSGGGDFILSLANSDLSGGTSKTFTVTAAPTDYIYYAIPSTYSTPYFSVGGFSGGFHQVSGPFAVTNSYGVVTNYQLWESDKVNLGATTVVVV